MVALAARPLYRRRQRLGPTYYPWSGGGVQSWPNNNTKIIVTASQGEMAETDTIDLHK